MRGLRIGWARGFVGAVALATTTACAVEVGGASSSDSSGTSSASSTSSGESTAAPGGAAGRDSQGDPSRASSGHARHAAARPSATPPMIAGPAADPLQSGGTTGSTTEGPPATDSSGTGGPDPTGGTGGVDGGSGGEAGVSAPEHDRTVTTSFYDTVRFLFDDTPPIQRDAEIGSFERTRVSLVQGVVLGPDDQPLPNARIAVDGHPEYGWTLSRGDGRYDLVVNGGSPLVLEFSAPEVMVAHRRWAPRWNESVELAAVKLIGVDPASTSIDFTDPIQTHVATEVADDDGVRQAVLMFRQGTVATMVMPDDTTQVASELHVRATEFTVGQRGPASMPADLPPGTMYTYAIEFSADEVENAGARTVRFEPPAVLYVDNFLDVPVGTVVPSGSYSRRDAAWNTEPNGRVIEILDVVGGEAVLAVAAGVAGNPPAPATPQELTALGITHAERQSLGAMYPIGTQLNRTPVLHFTEPLDCNFPGRPADGAIEPDVGDPEENPDGDCNQQRKGSILECEDQVLGERLPIAGTGFTLNYRSSRVPGAPSRRLRIPITSASPPPTMRRARLEVTVAGRTFEQAFEAPAANLAHEFTWDGRDAYGRVVQGGQPTRVCLTYDYPATYQGTDRAVAEEVFGDWAQDGVAVAGRSLTEVGLSRCFSRGPSAGAANLGGINHTNMIRLGGLDARTSAASLGGWTLSIHHTLGLETGTLYLGDGEKRDLGDSNQRIAIRVAGNGTATGAAVGPLALGAALVSPSAVAVGADGTIYVGSPGRVRRVTLDGALEAVAGTGTSGFSGDGGLATAARVSNSITALEVGDDGSVYIADAANGRIRRVTPDGIIRTIAGSGATSCAPQTLDTGMSEGQGDALAVPMPGVVDIEFASDDALWIATRCGSTTSRVRRLQNGKVRHVAGNPYPSWYATQVRPRVFTPHPLPPPPAVLQLYKIYGWDGSIRGDSTSYAPFGSEWAVLNNIEGMTPNGTGMYIAEGTGVGDIRIVPSDGGIRTFRTHYTLDGDPFDVCNTTGCAWQVASDGITEVPADITQLPGGIAYIASQGASQRIRWAPNDRQKFVEDIAGGGTEELNGERVITGAHRLRLRQPVAMDVGPDGALYVADQLGHKVIKLANAGPGFYEAVTIPSEDGSELYEFDETGRHLTTRDAATQALVWSFEYDAGGRLSAVRDAYDAATTIERTGGGAVTAIVSPDGVRTELALDPEGYLGGLVHPTGDAYLFEYQGDGLLTTMTTPRGLVHAFEYDDRGLLVRDENPEGGFQELERIATTPDAVSVEHRGALGIATVYDASEGELGQRTRTQHHPDGTTAVQADLAAGVHRTTAPDGTIVEVQTEPDPWLGQHAPFAARTSVTTPQGRSRIDTATRAFTEGPAGVLASATATTTAAGDPTRAWVTTFAAAQGATPAVAMSRSPQQRALRSTLGLHGRLERVEQGTWNGNAFVPGPFHALVLGYDARGRLETTTVGTRVTTVAYGGDGYVSQVVDAQGVPHGIATDAQGRATQLPLPGGGSIELGYDADGNVESVTPAGRPAHELVSNGVDALVTYAPPDLGAGTEATSFGYDLDGRPTDAVLPDGRTVTLGYDSAGRLASRTADDREVVLEYATTGALERIDSSWGGSTTFLWDGPLLMGTLRTGPWNGSLTWTYAADLRLATETVNGGATIAFSHDRDDLLTGAGALTLTRHNVTGAVVGTAVDAVTSMVTYTAHGEPWSQVYSHGAAPLFAEVLSYDALGRIESRTETIAGVAQTEDYSYDADGRLWTVERDGALAFTAEYDDNGNRTSLVGPGVFRLANHDVQDRLTSEAGSLYTFGVAGDLQSRLETGTDALTSYAYDEVGNLRSVELPDGRVIEYEHDGEDRPIGRRIDGVADRGWLWGRDAGPAAELNAAGDVESQFVYATFGHVPEYMIRDGQRWRLVTDVRGSVRLVVNTSTGAIGQRLDYDPWGVVTEDSNPGFQPFGYAGGLYDPDTGLVRFGARDYDAATGRWTTKDPIGFGGGDANLYAYVGGDPVNRVDPSGLAWWNSWDDLEASASWGVGALNDSIPGQLLIGLGDGASFGVTGYIRREWDDVFGVGGADVVKCTRAHAVGEFLGSLVGSIALPGAGLRVLARTGQRWAPLRQWLDRGQYWRLSSRSRDGGDFAPMLRIGRSPGNQFFWWGHIRL